MTAEQAQILLPVFLREHRVTVHHPEGLDVVLPLPTPDEFAKFYRSGRVEEVIEWLNKRERLLHLMAECPLDHGFEPDTWREADQIWVDRPDTELIACFGVNRGGKSFWAAKRLCEAARAYPGGTILIGSETQDSSVETAQKIVWHYLQNCEGMTPEGRCLAIGPYNTDHKRDPIVKVNYTMANGFTEGKLVLANRTTLLFATYNEDPAKYEGMEFGARVAPGFDGRDDLAKRKDGSPIQNIGYWLDESAGLAWVEMLKRRSTYRHARGIWSFTPINGLTPAMKEVLGSPTILKTRPAPLARNSTIPLCPPGHMPRLAEASLPRTMAFWFHLGDNPFGGYTQSVAQNLEGKPTETIERLAYGYARDTVHRAFPRFGSHNVVPIPELPERGTNYMVTDPSDKRPYFTIWVRVSPSGDHWVYRDWPDAARYGEWAVPTQRETNDDSRKGWDGDKGPAQAVVGMGYIGYRKLWTGLERVSEAKLEQDPHRRWLAQTGIAAEKIARRIIDTRAANTAAMQQAGTKTPLAEFATPAQDETTGQQIEPMSFSLAPADRIDAGLALIRDMLDWTPGETRVMGRARLWVAEHCQQVIWALRNFTGKGGEDGACKDPIDCLRYMAAANLVYCDPDGRDEPGRGWI